MERLTELLQIMYAVELLEYHDKNYLSGTPQSRSLERQRQILECTEIVQNESTKH